MVLLLTLAESQAATHPPFLSQPWSEGQCLSTVPLQSTTSCRSGEQPMGQPASWGASSTPMLAASSPPNEASVPPAGGGAPASGGTGFSPDVAQAEARATAMASGARPR